MELHIKFVGIASILLSSVILCACKHPLAIVGGGDIVEVGNSGRGCTLEQFRAGDNACTNNEVSGDYYVNYKAVPRPGWRFVSWEGPCPPDSDFQHCRFKVDGEAVAWWDDTHPDQAIPPSTAVFQPIEGETGYLLAGTPVAGVAYETPTQQGVTGLDGSFQYEAGETVRFRVGATVLGKVLGRARVTPFDLAGSPVLSGATVSLERAPPLGFAFLLWRDGNIYPPQAYTWQGVDGYGNDFFQRPDPFDTVKNITVLLQSLDEDAAPGNGIVIRAGVANLFRGVRLELSPQENSVPGYMEGAGSPGDFPTLHYKLAQANHNQLFSVAHGAVKPALALQRLYNAVGIPASTYAICPGGWDFDDSKVDCRYDANGNLTWLMLESGTVAHYEYDLNGNRTRQRTGQSIQNWDYNTLGDPVRATRDEDGDGIPENIETWQYDKFGNVTRYGEGDGATGTMDHVAVYEYDAQGKPVRADETVGGDPREGSTASWQYHPNGKLSQYAEAFTIATDGQLFTHTQVWQYDATGRLIRYRRDNEDTQLIGVHWVSTQTREYDEHGNFWVKEYEEHSGEESPSSLVRAGHYQFGDNGRLARYTRDNNLDGKREQLQTWQYDDKGRVVRYLRDDGFDSKPDYIETWQYAADGKTVVAQGSDATGAVIYARRWQYDAKDRLTRYTQEGEQPEFAGDEPEAPIVETWQYNPHGDLSRHTGSRGDEQTLIDSWLYDDEGNLTRFERNHDSLGEPGPIESWRFHTTGWGHLFSDPGIWWLYF